MQPPVVTLHWSVAGFLEAQTAHSFPYITQLAAVDIPTHTLPLSLLHTHTHTSSLSLLQTHTHTHTHDWRVAIKSLHSSPSVEQKQKQKKLLLLNILQLIYTTPLRTHDISH